MKKVLLVCAMALVLVSFTNVNNQKTILKDIDGTLLQSYAVIDNVEKSITFTVDANTTVSSGLVDGEFKIYLLENGNSNTTKEHTLSVQGNSLSFDSYFENSVDVASLNDGLISFVKQKSRPKVIL